MKSLLLLSLTALLLLTSCKEPPKPRPLDLGLVEVTDRVNDHIYFSDGRDGYVSNPQNYPIGSKHQNVVISETSYKVLNSQRVLGEGQWINDGYGNTCYVTGKSNRLEDIYCPR